MKKCKWFGCVLAVFFCALLSVSVVYAGGDEEEGNETEGEVVSTQTPEATQAPTQELPAEPSIPIESFSEEGNATARALLYDAATNKQFITIQTRNGAVFYVVIDYDKPLDEMEEQYQTYFLNLVDERDLEELLKEESENIPIVCTCMNKCELGAINTDCPLCLQDINECVGKMITPTSSPTTIPVEEAQQSKEKTKPSTGIYLLIVLLLLLVGGGAFAYVKLSENKKGKKVPNSLDDYEFDEDNEDDAIEYEIEQEDQKADEDEL